MDWYELNEPSEKHHIRTAFRAEFERIGKIKNHINLQLGAAIPELFATLLDDTAVNFRHRVRMMDVCGDWYRKNRQEGKSGLEDFF
jgi:hypothetical protein